MFKKNNGFISGIEEIIKQASENVANRIIELQKDVKGREEKISDQLESEITLHLLEEIKGLLNNKVINGVNFVVRTYTKKEEKDIGADLGGLIEVTIDGKTIKKAFLAQAKTAEVKGGKKSTSKYIYTYNKDIPGQAENMLSITSDSFFFLYTNEGIYVVSALHVHGNDKKSINTKELYYKEFGEFYSEFFKCFIGDHKIAEIYDTPEELEKFAEDNNVNNVLFIKAEKQEIRRKINRQS
ncbi:hypothetical protein ACQCVO_14910 [Bacillus infantis]|uniref:hypothetical protein n=1 Tax=Bacillus infantis TaxID=324767 RepID=UPI003CF54A19